MAPVREETLLLQRVGEPPPGRVFHDKAGKQPRGLAPLVATAASVAGMCFG